MGDDGGEDRRVKLVQTASGAGGYMALGQIEILDGELLLLLDSVAFGAHPGCVGDSVFEEELLASNRLGNRAAAQTMLGLDLDDAG